MPSSGDGVSRAAVWGSPIEHSLSPVLHNAAYRSLGLTHWEYTRREVDTTTFSGALNGLDETWAGLSLTMPLKECALAAGTTASRIAVLTGAANTLVRRGEGWYADNTDVPGLVAALTGPVALTAHDDGGLGVALTSAGVDLEHAVVVGAGATTRSALAALHLLGLDRVVVQCRRMHPETAATAVELGMRLEQVPLGDWPQAPGIVVSTVPFEAGEAVAETLPPAPPAGRVIDVVYGGGISPLARRAVHAGYLVVPGIEMLLHQAIEQVHLMTGLLPAVQPMRTALWTAGRIPGITHVTMPW